MKKCTFNDCDRKQVAKGYCHAHYQQIHVYGITPRPFKGTTNNIGYWGAHDRVYKRFGKASNYLCHYCISLGILKDAQQWAYLGGSKHEKWQTVKGRKGASTETISYSPEPLDYRPMCKSCHTRYDLVRARVIQTLQDS